MRRSGFTLMELMIVILIMGVVSTMGISIWLRVNEVWGASIDHEKLDQKTVHAFSLMREDFAASLLPEVTGVPLVGESSSYTNENEYWNVQMPADRISFSLREPDRNNREHAAVVTYSFDPTTHLLIRRVKALGIANAPSRDTTLLDGVLSFRGEYLAEDGTWKKEWKEKSMPVAVRVSVCLSNEPGGRPDEQICRKAIFPIHVR